MKPTRFIRPLPPKRLSGNADFDCPPVPGPPDHARRPLRVGFVIGSFTFGGSETETIELVYGVDSELIAFSGIAVKIPLPLPEGEPPRDGTFPTIYSPPARRPTSDPRVRVVGSFEDAARIVVSQSDIVLTWGLASLPEHLPDGRLPPIVVVSKDSGDWARNFLRWNALMTRDCVGNSTIAANAFPTWARGYVKTIPDGINPARVARKVDRDIQRRLWGFTPSDKIVGYLGRIEADKGVSKTVDGLANLPHDWKGVFIGANANCRYVEQLASHCESAIAGRYRILGWCHDVGSALAAFDVFSQPSEHEGFSNSLAEAWLAGVPTVYTHGTGAIPDLGDLGVPVSDQANGLEMAAAFIRAYGNEEVVSRARTVIERDYLATHNARRWTEYLISVHCRPRRVRIAALLPEAFTTHAYSWILSTCDGCNGVDLCVVMTEGKTHAMVERLERSHGCPSWPVESRADVEMLLRYARPDVLIVWGAATLDRLLPVRPRIPVIDAFALTRFEPMSSEIINTEWLRHLTLQKR